LRAYAIRRFLLIIPTLIILTILVFLIVRLIPGNVIDLMVAQREARFAEESLDRDAMEKMLGLDVPIHTQYLRWIGDIFRGDLGKSLWSSFTLVQALRQKLPVTIELSLLSMLVSLGLAIPIGMYAAIRQDTVGDYIMRTFSILALAVPSFWIASLIMIWPSIWWDWSPTMEYIPLVKDPLGNLGQFMLPAAIMGLFTSGGTMRITRTMMLEVMRQDYIRTAWAKGLRERMVVLRHAAKNTLIPVITIDLWIQLNHGPSGTANNCGYRPFLCLC